MCIYSKFSGGDPIMTAMALQRILHLGHEVNGLVQITGEFERKMVSV